MKIKNTLTACTTKTFSSELLKSSFLYNFLEFISCTLLNTICLNVECEPSNCAHQVFKASKGQNIKLYLQGKQPTKRWSGLSVFRLCRMETQQRQTTNIVRRFRKSQLYEIFKCCQLCEGSRIIQFPILRVRSDRVLNTLVLVSTLHTNSFHCMI